MALSRSRTSKRTSSSSSYTSTITTVAFIALCVIGVWMLTSNSIVPPQSPTYVAKTTTNAAAKTMITATDADLATNPHELPQISPESVAKKDQPAYEDNPGDLPSDAIQSDDPKNNNEVGKEQSHKHDSAVDISSNDQEKSRADPSNVEEKAGILKGKESVEEQDEKQTQISEESTMTQTQLAGQSSKESSESSEESQKTSNEENNKSQQQQSTTSENSETSSEQSQTQKSDRDQEQDQEQKEDGESSKTSQESQTQTSNEDQQQKQEATQSSNVNHNQESQENTKSFEEQQQEQLREDAGIQEPHNQVTEEDQQQRMHQQHQQQEEQQKQDSTSNDETHQQQQQKQQEESSEPQLGNETYRTKEQNKDQTLEASTKAENHGIHHQSHEPQGHGNVDMHHQTKHDLTTMEDEATETNPNDSTFPASGTSGIPKESKESKKSWSTQAAESEIQKEKGKKESDGKESIYGYTWELCNVTAGPDYIPCLDNEKALRHLRSTKHFEHRERHCPEEGPTCLVLVPQGYKKPIAWPSSRDKIWYHNVPHTLLAEFKGHQNWVKVTGEFLTFPGGGTQFIHGALHYVDFIQQSVPNIAWGKHTRVVLDVGCGVASFGAYLFERDVLTMSFAPKDEHEAQVQFALERGIPAISAVMGSKRLPFPSRVFDLIHCARCRVPWHVEGGKLLLELNRMLRPGGYFVWSATPVYQKLKEDVAIWQAMSKLTVSMCWELVTIKKDKLNSVGAAIYRKPLKNDCYDQRKKNEPPMCETDDDANAAWYVPLKPCMHRVPVEETERGTRWPEVWPKRLQTPPYWLNSSQMGIYGRPAPQDFTADYKHWKHVVSKSYMKGLGIDWTDVRNVMDMRAVYGGFAAALKDLQVWVMNIVNIDSPDTLPIIYERGLFGIYHDWCESFSTYPRTYDLLHADHLFSKLKTRCKLAPVLAEVDRIVRPGGQLIVRDESSAIGEVENLLKSLRWEVHLTFSKDQEGLLSAQKGDWRPQTYAASS